VSSTLRPSSPPIRAAPTFLLHHQSFHTRLLSRPDRWFVGAEPQRCPPPCSAVPARRSPLSRKWALKSTPCNP
jgi:hypothetical protein